MKFTQPLGVGLGLAVRINNQYSKNKQTIIQQSTICGKYHGITSYLLGNIDAGTQEFAGKGNRVNKGQTRRTDESQMMMSRQGRTSESHKRITQMYRTKQDDVTPKNGNNK